MKDRTPFEVLIDSGLTGVNQFMKFPIMILDHNIDALRRCTEPLLFEHDVKLAETKRHGVLLDPKTLLDISSKYDFFMPNAQKVLTYYRNRDFLEIASSSIGNCVLIWRRRGYLYGFPVP